MNKKDTGGPAFPESIEGGGPFGGMTLRDWFAGQVMAQLCVVENTRSITDDARAAYNIADAMIAERNK